MITSSKKNTTYRLAISETGTYQIKATFEGSTLYETSTTIVSINQKFEFSSSSIAPSAHENLPFTIISGTLAVTFSLIAVRYKRKLQIIGGEES